MLSIFGRRRERLLAWPLPLWNTMHLRMYSAANLDALARSSRRDEVPKTLPVAHGLFVGVDIVGDGRKSVSKAQDRAWGDRDDVPFSALIRAAIRRAPFGTEERLGGTAVIADEEQAAALLVDSNRAHTARVIQRLTMRGDTVVFPLSATQTVVTGSEDESGIALALDRAERLIESRADLVSIQPQVWRNAQWLPFIWRRELPRLEPRIGDVVSRFDAQQKAALGRAHRVVGRGR